MIKRLLVPNSVCRKFIRGTGIGRKDEDWIWQRSLHPDEWKGPKEGRPDTWTNPGFWVEEHYPMKMPETEEQRRASARKYGIREGDYKPLPIDSCLGEYPDLGFLTHDMKDPFENWTDTTYKRNFGEPMAYEYFAYLPTRITYTGIERITPERGSAWFVFSTIALALLFWLFESKGPHFVKPMLSKQFPFDMDRAFPRSDSRIYPLTHYTFEPAED